MIYHEYIYMSQRQKYMLGVFSFHFCQSPIVFHGFGFCKYEHEYPIVFHAFDPPLANSSTHTCTWTNLPGLG